jgi:hypothetical protein
MLKDFRAQTELVAVAAVEQAPAVTVKAVVMAVPVLSSSN